ncbi:MAG TPA: family 78 glycoside hydrolase catalytic domain [Kineosporiaceae bacterium]|nr:family 78 glycoside hydrolase catalytic domain [Kineosporiaceae bacterium]
MSGIVFHSCPVDDDAVAMLLVEAPTVEHHQVALGINESRPRLSWTIDGPRGWRQRGYEIEVCRADRLFRTGFVAGDDQVLVAWPDADLVSRSVAQVRVRVWGGSSEDDEASESPFAASDWSPSTRIESGLLCPEDWSGTAISPDWDEDTSVDNPPALLRRTFTLAAEVRRARLYVTAHGVTEVEINGTKVGEQALLPGWTTYSHRLRVATFDVTTRLQPGANTIGAWLADGWYRGRLGFDGGTRNIYGDRLALLAQLEIEDVHGRVTVVRTDESWQASRGPILRSGLYDGERYDARKEIPNWSGAGVIEGPAWSGVRPVERDLATLTGFDGPYVQCVADVPPVDVRELGSSRYLLDFGQNLVGRLRIQVRGAAGDTVRLTHAEVLQDGELYRRPLRDAEALDEYILRGDPDGEVWEPRFTVHGFRYAEIDGWVGDSVRDHVVARVYHSDLRATGSFECSDELVNRLHENVIWSMRGNMVDLPTDCPQRDERLGWTGDVQVFAPTAAFLFDCSGFLGSWLKDLDAEQLPDGTVPWYVPVIPGGDYWTPIRPGAAWADAVVLTPWTLWERYGDRDILERQFDGAKAWVDLVARLSDDDHVWRSGFQLGDWLDPIAPPEDPAAGRTDRHLVATAYAAWSARHVGLSAAVLGRSREAQAYAALAQQIRAGFQAAYVLPDGTLTSDAPTAYALAIMFDLLPADLRERAGRRLADLVRASGHLIATGFVGTPLICDALTRAGFVEDAYRLLLQRQCPSWLFMVEMGATTIWERWDSMLPDGSVNPGGMTSFNHYALGAVADWLHRVVAGLQPAAPGYRRVRFAPRPGGGLTSAQAVHESPYGRISISWRYAGDVLIVDTLVPIGVTAVLDVQDHPVLELVSGRAIHRFRGLSAQAS